MHNFPLSIVANMQFPADLVTFTEEILNGKLHFLYLVTLDYSFTVEKKKTENSFNFSTTILSPSNKYTAINI